MVEQYSDTLELELNWFPRPVRVAESLSCEAEFRIQIYEKLLTVLTNKVLTNRLSYNMICICDVVFVINNMTGIMIYTYIIIQCIYTTHFFEPESPNQWFFLANSILILFDEAMAKHNASITHQGDVLIKGFSQSECGENDLLDFILFITLSSKYGFLKHRRR